VLNVKPGDGSVDALPELTLEDGDRLIVPYRPATVSVLGAVYDQADFVFRPGLRVSDYLKQAGGTTRTGDRRRIYIIRANGSVSGRAEGSSLFSGGIMGERLNPGDAIVVPEQINKTTLTKNLLDYSQILSQFGLGVAAIKVLAP
jgi:protein involved in polysaccharide export with SLBB domain